MTNPYLPREPRHDPAPFLSILPSDLHYILGTYYLDFDTLLALRQTCRSMYTVLTPDVVRRVRARLIQRSLEMEKEQFRAYRSIYPRQRLGHIWDLLYAAFDFRLVERPVKELTCYGCLEIKPLWCFVEKMSNRGTGLGAKFAQDRMCKDCMRQYRDIEGRWYKDNWVKKSDMVRKFSRGRRVRQWIFEGRPLVNPDEEIGVCANCGSGSFELWWGCVSCFELEEKRRRDLDLGGLTRLQRKIFDVVDSWRVRIEIKERQRHAAGSRRRRKSLSVPNVTWTGSFSDRKAALIEWKESKGKSKSEPLSRGGYSHGSSGCNGSRTPQPDLPWRAINQIPLPNNRRELRCSSCWVPNCPRRTYMLGLAYEGPLPMERWCEGCQRDYEERHARKEELKMRKAMRNDEANGISGDGWLDGLELGRLFDDQEGQG
ncbi:hypothetical protein A1O1_07537 [Capronia coronata CBS 617.96]|uniref:F-box domain-containing protein n=1 Tax=Capronia coronata CBS 617.96 TaxID=1182541 RepID=W9XUM3_9EURO|nr:uncharacterized protein A1O1_07537 [Capronia coronata CBS 617.96]EXJ83908.1 hypothetical protein A1O1_07537 [Capronia coronata CBS 617.96]